MTERDAEEDAMTREGGTSARPRGDCSGAANLLTVYFLVVAVFLVLCTPLAPYPRASWLPSLYRPPFTHRLFLQLVGCTTWS